MIDSMNFTERIVSCMASVPHPTTVGLKQKLLLGEFR